MTVYPQAFPDAYTGHREESWRWEKLDLDGAPLGILDGASPDSELEFSIHNKIRGGGTLRWSGTALPDWGSIRVQPWYTAVTGRGQVSRPLGVFIPSTPVVDWGDGIARASVELYDKLLLLDRDKVDQTFALDAGTVVTTAVSDIVAGIGEQLIIEASTETLASPLVWEADTSKLQIVNALLDAINYFALTVDGFGVFRAKPYEPPASRSLAWPFLDNELGLSRPAFKHERDEFDIPNKVICITQGDGTTAGLVGVATNTDPASPASYQARGNKWYAKTYTNVEATSQAVVDAIAQRRLDEATQLASTVDITHPILPLDLNDRVRFRRGPAGLDLSAVVQSMKVRTGLGAVVQSTVREVIV